MLQSVSTGKKWSKRRDNGNAESVLPCDQVSRQDAPGSLSVPNPVSPGEFVDRLPEFDTLVDHLSREPFGHRSSARAAKGLALAIGYVGPALKENLALAAFGHNIQTAFEAHKVFPRFAPLAGNTEDFLTSMPSAGHEFLA